MAAARYAALQVELARLIEECAAYKKAVATALKNETTARTELKQLQGQLAALQRGEHSEEAKTLACKINDAEEDIAAARVDAHMALWVNTCHELQAVKSAIDAMQGALLA